jgi:hypothetical protein
MAPGTDNKDEGGSGPPPIRVARWGEEVPRERKMPEIAVYHESAPKSARSVESQTWADLDMDSVFAKADRTVTMLGRQVFYHQLRTPSGDDILSQRASQQDFMRKDKAARETVLSILGRLNKPGSDWLVPLILNPLPKAPRHSWAIYFMSLLALASLLGSLFHGPLLLLGFGIVLVNAGIHMKYGIRITPYYSGFSQIGAMLGVGRLLSELPYSISLPQIESLRGAQPVSASLKKKLGWIAIADPDALSEPARTAVEYLNTFFLFDIIVFLRSLSALKQDQATLVLVLEGIGSLDATISAASYLESLPTATRPRIVDTRELSVTGIYHPLIPNFVSNSVSLVGRSALVAGPNMAGKTAFIKTIGINLILSQTLGICLAESAVLPRADVYSAIKREDSLQEGKSYFFTEIDQILNFIRLSEKEALCLFLIDEPFRGTNTIERIASSAAVLRYLARNQTVMASTHDGELQALIGDSFDMLNFSDQVTGGSYGFDYRLRQGPARSRNAIKLLQLRGYPSSVIEEAELLANRLSAAWENRGEAGQKRS